MQFYVSISRMLYLNCMKQGLDLFSEFMCIYFFAFYHFKTLLVYQVWAEVELVTEGDVHDLLLVLMSRHKATKYKHHSLLHFKKSFSQLDHCYL